MEKAGFEKGRWSAFSRYSEIPIWRLSRILRGKHMPSLLKEKIDRGMEERRMIKVNI